MQCVWQHPTKTTDCFIFFVWNIPWAVGRFILIALEAVYKEKKTKENCAPISVVFQLLRLQLEPKPLVSLNQNMEQKFFKGIVSRDCQQIGF
jgi:hypothetical protein